MQRDPRQRGREGENCFSCYLLPATFQIITKQMPILESHLNKVWDWTIIEENKGKIGGCEIPISYYRQRHKEGI